MRRNRLLGCAFAVVLAGSGCSDAGSSDQPVVVEPTFRPTTTTPAVAGDARSLGSVAPIETESRRVDMAVVIESAGVEANLGAAIDPATLGQVDPFGTFASCSGGRRTFGPYSVLVSVPDGSVAAAGVFTTDSVTGPGIYDADIRTELRSGPAQSAVGTVTISADFRSGSFVAFEADGSRLSGSFACTGGDPPPAPLDTVDESGVLDSIEVFALLRRDGAERIVGLAVDFSQSPEVVAECPAAVGILGQVVARVDGDQTIGAVTAFELTDGGTPTLRLDVGGVSYAFDDVTLAVGEPATAGTFSATAEGLSVDGAFRCT